MKKVGDVVRYKKDWKPGRDWYVYAIHNGLYTIVIIRDGKYTNDKNGEQRLNASIVNIREEDLCVQ